MHEMYERGVTLSEVATSFQVSRERVRQLLVAAGFKTRTIRETAALKRARDRHRAEEIVSAFRRSRDAEQVARKLAVPRNVVNEVLNEQLTLSERRASWKSPKQRFSDAELIEFVQIASRELGGILSATEYTAFARERHTSDGRPWATHQTHFHRFGSWRNALQAAGLRANPPSAITGKKLFEPEHCIDAIRAIARDLGKAPTAAEYDECARQAGGALPSLATVRNRCGRWNEALSKAGM
jgi:plasmid maintenance system antidote protein VapI